MNIKKYLFKYIGAYIGICLFFTSVSPAGIVFAAGSEVKNETDSEIAVSSETVSQVMDYDTVLKNSLVFYVNKPFYYSNGEKKYFYDNDKGYLLPVADNKPLITITLLHNLTGIKYKWDARSEIIKLFANGHNVSMRIGEDCITFDDVVQPLATPSLFKNNRVYVSIADVLQYLGFHTYYSDGLAIVSESQELSFDVGDNIFLLNKFKDLFHDYIINSDFEKVVSGSALMLPNRKSPEGWSFNNWANPKVPNVDAGITTDEHASGNHSVYIDAVDSYMSGFQSAFIPLNRDSAGYQIEFKIKKTADYANNTPQIMVLYYNKGNFISSSFRGGISYDSDEWVENTLVIPKSIYPSSNCDSFRIVIINSFSGKSGTKGVGRIFFDDVKIGLFNPNTNTLKAAIRPNVEGSWYILGDEVVYKALDYSPLEHLKGVKGIIYNSNNEVVDEKDIDIDEMMKNGWKWTPKEVGFYDVQFLGMQKSGPNLIPIVSPFVGIGSSTTKEHIGVFERDRHSFFVAAKKTKPIEERNQHIYFSEHGSMPLAFKLADYIGFSGIRIHWIPWGPYGSDPLCIQPERGVYKWDFMDERINGMKQYNFNIIGNVLYTPRWASSHPELTNYGAFGMYDYSVYAPADMNDWNEFLTALVTRYKDDIKAWEIWNEPNIPGSSAFWKDTPEKYAEMLKNAYITIKGIQPDSTIIIGGVGGTGYLAFYKALYQDPEIANYYDVIGMHGRNTNIWDYNRVEEKYGVAPKKYMNTEGHYMLLNSKTSPKVDYTEKQMSVRMMEGYFHDLKFGATDITLFHVYHSSQTELETLSFYKKEQKTQDSSCMYRYTPYAEPRHMVSVLHTFFELMGKDFKYEKEFLLENNVKSVLFANDGKPLLALWSEHGNKFKLDSSIIDCMTDETIIYDWEGRITNPADYTLTGSTMYFITGLDQSKLDQKESTDNVIITNDMRKNAESANVPSGVSNVKPIFNKNTFEVSEDVKWNEADWNWVKSLEDKDDKFAAKYAVSVTSEGLYLMVDVVDDTFVTNPSTNSSISWQYDSIQLALDTGGFTESADRLEFQIGIVDGNPTIYKEAAPYVGGNLVSNWTKPGSNMPRNYIKIENQDGHILYKFFLPTSEMYPYAYVGGKETLRMSVIANDNDGSGRKGYLEWSSGIGGTKSPTLYGKVLLGE